MYAIRSYYDPILPPIIDALTPGPATGEILVYLPFETPEAIRALLSRFSSVRFACFHPAFSEPCQQGNLNFRPLGRESFVQALAGCEGVISNAGFELASEALSLGKKLLLKPVAGQFEQASNALTLEIMGVITSYSIHYTKLYETRRACSSRRM